jgi:hypothetical protein
MPPCCTAIWRHGLGPGDAAENAVVFQLASESKSCPFLAYSSSRSALAKLLGICADAIELIPGGACALHPRLWIDPGLAARLFDSAVARGADMQEDRQLATRNAESVANEINATYLSDIRICVWLRPLCSYGRHPHDNYI